MNKPTIGIDTSVLIRLVTGQPPDTHAYCLERLNQLVNEGIVVIASNQVIGEAFATIQFRYGMARSDARAGLLRALTGGLVAPQNGPAVLDVLVASGRPGLFDRLIAQGYDQTGLDTLTLDRAMARLPNARLL